MYNQCNSLYGSFRQVKFNDIYEDVNEFLDDYKNVGIPTTIQEINARTLYYLLYANFGNSTLANSDTTQFKYKLFAIIWQYAPDWEKQLDIQNKLRTLSDDDLTNAGRTLFNHAYNPSTAVVENPETYSGTLADKELAYVDDQNATHNTRSKLEAYGVLMALLKKDVTKEFLDRFKKLFLVIVEPEKPLYYESEDEENE
jgi:hypothetical protein